MQLYLSLNVRARSKRPSRHRPHRPLAVRRTLFKSRSLAAQAVTGGRVHVNGARVKPAHEVRAGTGWLRARHGAIRVRGGWRATAPGSGGGGGALLPGDARKCRARREFAARMKLAAGLTARPSVRPDKRERRQLRRLRVAFESPHVAAKHVGLRVTLQTEALVAGVIHELKRFRHFQGRPGAVELAHHGSDAGGARVRAGT